MGGLDARLRPANRDLDLEDGIPERHFEDSMTHYWQALMRGIDHMHTQHWLLALVVAVVIGALCMRGFGSRSTY